MDKTLQHYGILGMKWGVRRTKAQLRRARGPDTPRKVTKEQYEAEKKKAIRSGDKATIEKWKDHFDNNEYRAALDRIDLDQRLYPTSDAKIKNGRAKVYDVIGDIGKTVGLVTSLVSAYEVVRRVNNTFNSKKLPTIEK